MMPSPRVKVEKSVMGWWGYLYSGCNLVWATWTLTHAGMLRRSKRMIAREKRRLERDDHVEWIT